MSDYKPSPPGDSIRVTIFNQVYNLRSATGDAEYLRRVAQLVDERMRSIASQLAVHDVAKVAVLAALNLADELEILKDSFERELSALLMMPPGEEAEPFDAAQDETHDAARYETPGETFVEQQNDAPSTTSNLSSTASATEPTPEKVIADEQAWFDSVFDPDPTRGSERLSAQVSTRLKNHVSARLRRLRQPAPKPSITEDTGRDY
ncbi:MAG TPA: cell division protein ZapA [Pyrinomonadaceae bacterium]|jgi:cell division protein ZapA|nr:cell division protein ZapA [Pyrinomonadaceae bacterium]